VSRGRGTPHHFAIDHIRAADSAHIRTFLKRPRRSTFTKHGMTRTRFVVAIAPAYSDQPAFAKQAIAPAMGGCNGKLET
jgi:hypothetical protein